MKYFAYLLVAFFIFSAGNIHAEKLFESDLIQPPTLAAPKAGFAAGSYATFSPESQDFTQGTVPIPLAIAFPEERGPLLVDLTPTYRYNQGLSEWGQGWLQNLAITRFKELGNISYETDEFISPWGELKKGSDGYFYTKGLDARVRIEKSADSTEFIAFMPNGDTLVYGREARIVNASGTYSWNLSEARSRTGFVTLLKYEKNASGRLFLKSVSYGSRKDPQYQIIYDYRVLSDRMLYDLKSGYELSLDRLVSSVNVFVKTTNGFESRWRYTLNHSQIDEGVRYFLKSFQKTLSDGTTEPAIIYEYATLNDATLQNNIVDQGHLTEVMQGLPAKQFYSRKVAYYDANYDGNLDIERADTLETYLFRDGKYVRGGKVDVAAMQPECKTFFTPSSNPEFAEARNLVSFLGPGKPYFQLTFKESDEGIIHNTDLSICDLQGKLLHRQNFKGKWTHLKPSEKHKIADINNDGKPDFIWLSHTHFIVRLNESTDKEFKIGPDIDIRTTDQIEQKVPGYSIYDMNGDGLPDIVGRGKLGYRVYFNLGNAKFNTRSVPFLFVDRFGNTANIGEQEQIFIDLNRDGLSDVVSVDQKTSSVHTWLNRGNQMKQILIPNTYKIPAIASSPRAVDLIGSGDDQIIYTAGLGQWQTLAFNRPETGLLTRVNNGKGVELSFFYQRSIPIPLAQTRLSVIKSLRVKKGLHDAKETSFGYSFPKIDQNAHFLGFGRVETASAGIRRNAVYSIDENMGSSLVFQETSDDKVPRLKRIIENGYQGLDFHGLPVRVLTNAIEYWQDGAQKTNALTKSNSDFDPNLCAKKSSESDGVSTLESLQSFSAMPNWAQHIHCKVAGETLAGSHADPSLNFSYTTAIDRTEAGQEKAVWRVVGGQKSLIEEASFDDDFRPTSVSAPGKGTTTITYDPKIGTPDSIVNPDGTVIKVSEFDGLSSLIKRLDTIRGSANYSQRFNFDSLDRLKNSTNSLFDPTFETFTSEYSYADATLDKAGLLRSVSASDDGLGTIIRHETMELFDGAARSLGKIWKRAGGWHANRWTRILDAKNQIQFFANETAPKDYLDFLKAVQPNQVELSSESNSAFGQVESSKLWQENAREDRNVVWKILSGKLYKESILNGKAAGSTGTDAFGRTVQYIDPLNNSFTYTFDVLGRTVASRLPSGTEHVLRFNAFGEPDRIDHSEVGSVSYTYHPGSRLLKTRTYADRLGEVDRIENNEYDEIGRIKSRTYTKGSDTKSFVYSYSQSLVSDQFGFLESVTGPNFKKEFKYRVDGKVISSRMTFFDGQVFEKTVTYTRTDANRSETITYSAPFKPAQVSTRSFTYDEFGRTKLIEFKNGAVKLDYDDRNRVSSATWNNQNIRFNYDPDSQLLRGYAANDLRPDRWEFGWDFNVDGQIKEERYFQPSFGSASSTYSYDERFFLKTAERGPALSYAFDQDGLSTLVASKSIGRTTGKITAGDVEFGLDSSRRIKSKGSVQFEYGPNGRMLKTIRNGKTSSAYDYDETSQLISREPATGSTVYYFEGAAARDSNLSEPLKINGITLGVVKNGSFEFVPFDVRGTALPKAGTDWADPFGQRKAPVSETSLDFAGQYRDPDSSFVIMGSRFYDPDLGMFSTPDPALFEDLKPCTTSPSECNLFGYARNNPMSFTDPTGTLAWLVVPLITYGVSELIDTDTVWAPGPKDNPQSNWPGLDQQQERMVDRGLDIAAKVVDTAIPGPNVIAPTIKMAKETVKNNKRSPEGSSSDSPAKVIKVSKTDYPESAKHILDAQAAGHPAVLTPDRANAKAQRRESLRGVETKKDYDRDEYPPAFVREGGKGASVRHIDPSDNRGAGACIGAQCRDVPDGGKIRIEVVD